MQHKLIIFHGKFDSFLTFELVANLAAMVYIFNHVKDPKRDLGRLNRTLKMGLDD